MITTRTRSSITAALAALATLAACKGTTDSVGVVPVDRRPAPLTPATRAELEAQGASCTPNAAGPVLCTWSNGAATCRLTYAADDTLTHLDCAVDGLSWTCTHPADVYACTWSDDPSCADVYDAAGHFEAYLCGSALDARLGRSGDAGVPTVDGGAVECWNLDERSCLANPACVPHYCPTCTDRSYVLCTAPGGPIPGCARPICEPCEVLDEGSCSVNPACRFDRCPSCDGTVTGRCLPADAPRTACPQPGPSCARCDGLDEQSCTGSRDCHPVYRDDQNCACPTSGCCTRFERCAEGPSARCTEEPVACDAMPPHCEPPYVVAYAGACYEGCVLPDRCEPPPPSGITCGADPSLEFPVEGKACTEDRECEAVLHQIDCCGSQAAIGINAGLRPRWDELERRCVEQYPPCDCVARPTVAEDGGPVSDPTRLRAICRQGLCTSVGS